MGVAAMGAIVLSVVWFGVRRRRLNRKKKKRSES